MGKEEYSRELLKKLESGIGNYDRVVLIREKGEKAQRWLEAFGRSEAVKHTKQKILVWYVEKMWMVSEGQMSGEDGSGNGNIGMLDRSFREMSVSNICWKPVTEAEAKELWRLYHMYEFSNRFLVVPETEIYGGLLNFVDTGLLQMGQVWEALLW